MKYHERVKFLKGFLKGDRNDSEAPENVLKTLPIDEVVKLLILETKGLGRGQWGYGPRRYVLQRLHMRFNKLRRQEEWKRLASGDPKWFVNVWREKVRMSDISESESNNSED